MVQTFLNALNAYGQGLGKLDYFHSWRIELATLFWKCSLLIEPWHTFRLRSCVLQKLLELKYLQFALWITVPAPYFAQMVSALSQGGSWQLSAHNLRFGDRQHMNFCYSPRSSVLWYIFQLSIGQIQGEHFGQEYFVRPITFSLRLSTADFEASAHNWNRYYVDFFTYLAPEFVLSPRHTFTLKSMVVLTHGFNLQTLLTVFTHVRSGWYPALCMLMRIPIGKQQYDFATQPSYGSEPPWQILLSISRAKL